MKYLKYFLILLFIPFVVNAEECDTSDITITSIEQSGIEGNTETVSEPIINGVNIGFDLKMYDIGDSITYDLEIKNDSEEDYMIDEDTFKTDSSYIEYSLKTNDDSNVVKAQSVKGVTLVVTYKKEVEDEKLSNNKFDASNSLKLSLSTDGKEKTLDIITTDNIEEVKNPLTNTSSIMLISFILLTTIIVACVLIKRKNKYTKYILIALSIVLVPTVYAICQVDIEVESKIEIEKLPRLYDTIANLAMEGNACVTKYEGVVTDEVGKTVNATNVYFDSCEERNVIFGGFCWQVVRTTETKGTKLIYNGEPVDGKCESNRNNHTGIVGANSSTESLSSSYLYGNSFSYDITNNTFSLIDGETANMSDSTYEDLVGKFTCKNITGTCTTIYNINGYEVIPNAYTSSYTIGDTNYAQIGTSAFNINHRSPAMAGYMFNKVYNFRQFVLTSGSLTGNDVLYSNGVYTLLPAEGESNLGTTLDASHHYTCNNTTGTCNQVRYYYYTGGGSSGPGIIYTNNYYIVLSGEANIEEAINNMLYNDNVNRYNSSIKGIIDSWYKQKLLNKTNMLEDTVYCNARDVTNQETNAWNKDGLLNTYMSFKNYTFTKDLSCTNITDQFAITNNKAKLTYPVGLATREELYTLTRSNNSEYYNLLGTGALWWDLSPSVYGINTASVGNINNNGKIIEATSTQNIRGVRPMVSLVRSSLITGGDGSETNPWKIK